TDPARAQAIFGKYTETTDPAILEGAYQVFAAKTDAVPYVRAAAVQTAIAEVAQEDPRAADLRAEDFVDNRYVQAIEETGFIRELYGPGAAVRSADGHVLCHYTPGLSPRLTLPLQSQ